MADHAASAGSQGPPTSKSATSTLQTYLLLLLPSLLSLLLIVYLYAAGHFWFDQPRRAPPSYPPTSSSSSSSPSLLAALVADEFDWSASTTPIPISVASVWLKLLLSGGNGAPDDLLRVAPPADTIPILSVRQWLNAKRFHRVITQGICNPNHPDHSVACNTNEQDATYGLTPLHLATASGDTNLVHWLLEHGADPHVEDAVGRKPANLSYTKFISNSKRWARDAGRTHCDLPEVVFQPHDSPEQIARAAKEVRRLISEGEPVLMRGAFRHFATELVNGWTVENFVKEHGDFVVTVGQVPYASAFNLSTEPMPLREYYEKYVKTDADVPLYVFNKDPAVNREGYAAILNMLRSVAPIPELIADPEQAGGIDGIHFFLGRANSGAPHHIHADALNVVVSGSKRWFIFTPGKSIYSRKHVKIWVDEDYPHLDESDQPLECVQGPGDAIYVPLDWGHAIINLEENTFGYALELLNKRDTYMTIGQHSIDGRDEL